MSAWKLPLVEKLIETNELCVDTRTKLTFSFSLSLSKPSQELRAE